MPATRKRVVQNVEVLPSIATHFKAEKKTKSAKPRGKLSEEARLKRSLNRFNGMTEEEVLKRGLPDYLKEDLDIVFIGINPGLTAAFSGRYYGGPGNHFWQALHLSGLSPTPMTSQDDFKMLELNMDMEADLGIDWLPISICSSSFTDNNFCHFNRF